MAWYPAVPVVWSLIISAVWGAPVVAQHFVLAPLTHDPEWDGCFRESQVYPVSRYQMQQQMDCLYQ